MNQCQTPPTGWTCTRPRGHAGPCAAVPCRRFRAIVWRVILVALALFWACIGYLVFG